MEGLDEGLQVDNRFRQEPSLLTECVPPVSFPFIIYAVSA